MAFKKENTPGDFNARHSCMTRFGKNLKTPTQKCVQKVAWIIIFSFDFKIRDKNSFLKNKEVKSEKLLWWVSSAGRKIIDIIFAERPLIIEKNK